VIFYISGDGRRNAFLRIGMGELKVVGVLYTLPREGFFEEIKSVLVAHTCIPNYSGGSPGK
jgi:hypothetical protein